MHNKKNVFDNVFNTIIDVMEKPKEKLKAQHDVEMYYHSPELLVFGAGEGKMSVPKVCYSLTVETKKALLEYI
jgi:hypothetical protein